MYTTSIKGIDVEETARRTYERYDPKRTNAMNRELECKAHYGRDHSLYATVQVVSRSKVIATQH